MLPSYSNKLSTENTEQIARIKNNFIVLNLPNKDFNNIFTIIKYQEICYIFLNNQKSYKKVITEYKLISKITKSCFCLYHTHTLSAYYCKTEKEDLSLCNVGLLVHLSMYHFAQSIFEISYHVIDNENKNSQFVASQFFLKL